MREVWEGWAIGRDIQNRPSQHFESGARRRSVQTTRVSTPLSGRRQPAPPVPFVGEDRGQKRQCVTYRDVTDEDDGPPKRMPGREHKWLSDPPVFPEGVDTSDGYCMLVGVFKGRGSLSSFRWLEGDPRDKFDPVILGSGDSVFTESANVAVNWVRANMQSMTERYGQPKYDPTKRGLMLNLTNLLVANGGTSAGVAVAAGLVAFCWDMCMKPDVVATGEITLTGLVLDVNGMKEKVEAACRHGIITTVVLSYKNVSESGAVQEQRLFAIEDEAAATTPSPPTTTATSSGQQQSTGEAERRTEARKVEIDFSDHPEVKRRLEEGGLQVQPVTDMWEALAALVFPPKGRMAAASTWVPGKGAWQARLQSPWLMHERFVALQLVEVSIMMLGTCWVKVTGGKDAAAVGASVAHGFIRCCLTELQARLPGEWRPYEQWLAGRTEGEWVPQFHVHYPSFCVIQTYNFSAAVAVGMVAVLAGREVDPSVVVMGQLEALGHITALPPIESCHFQGMIAAGVRKVFMPVTNARQVMALAEYPESGVEVVAMANLLDHLQDIFNS